MEWIIFALTWFGGFFGGISVSLLFFRWVNSGVGPKF